MSDLDIAAIVCTSIGGALFLLFWITMLLRQSGRLLAPGYQMLMVASLVLSVIILMIAFSILVQLTKWWLFGYLILLMALLALYIYSLYWSFQENPPDGWLRNFWDAQKAFGGGAFGDFANAIGLLSGVGVYKLSQADEAWFWLGLYGAFLAILAGLSLFQRSNLDIIQNQNSRSKGRWRRWNALGNLTIGVFTLLAITCPLYMQNLNPPSDNYSLVQHWGLKVPLWIASLLIFINWLFVYLHFRSSKPDGVKFTWDEELPWWLALVMIIGNAGVLITNQFVKPFPDWTPALFGACAFLTWIILEAAGLLNNRTDYFRVMRGLLIIGGSIIMIYLTISLAAAPPTSFEEIHWFLFSESLVLITTGVLLGVAVSIYEIAMRHKDDLDLQFVRNQVQIGRRNSLPASGRQVAAVSGDEQDGPWFDIPLDD